MDKIYEIILKQINLEETCYSLFDPKDLEIANCKEKLLEMEELKHKVEVMELERRVFELRNFLTHGQDGIYGSGFFGRNSKVTPSRCVHTSPYNRFWRAVSRSPFGTFEDEHKFCQQIQCNEIFILNNYYLTILTHVQHATKPGSMIRLATEWVADFLVKMFFCCLGEKKYSVL